MLRQDWIVGLILLAVTVLAYAPAWHGQPVWDDDAHLTRTDLQSMSGLARIWIQPGATQQYYPLVHTVFWLEHKVWGNATLGYHLVNILLHGVSALLFLKMLRRLAVPGAPLAAAVFALHPVHVESVAWMSELKNTLSGVFCLAAALSYLRFDRDRNRRAYAVALGLFVLGLASKTVIATLPAALLIVFWWQRGGLTWKRDAAPLVPFFILGLVAGLFTAWMERTFIGAEGAAFDFSPIERCLIAGRAVWFYVAKLCWPADLVFIYPRWHIHQAIWQQYAWPAAALGLSGLLIAWSRRNRGPLAAWLFFVGTLFPALGFLNVYPFRFSFVADHFQYLSSLGLITLFSAAVAAGAARTGRRGQLVVMGSCAVVLVLLGFLTWKQCGNYANEERLWLRTLARNPESFLAHNNLGKLLVARGQSEAARQHFETAIGLQPDNAEARNNLGNILLGLNRVDDALVQFQKAVELRPAFANARNNVGYVLLGRGRLDEAIVEFQEALEADPGLVQARCNLGAAYIQKGRIEDAIAQYEAAVRTEPGMVAANEQLGDLLLDAGRVNEAIARFKKLAEIQPDDAAIQGKVGGILLQAGSVREAVACFENVVRLQPGSAEAHNNLGAVFLALGQPDRALACFEKALAADPNSAGAHNNLGYVLLARGRVDEAVGHFQKALELRPEFVEAHNNLGNAYLLKGRMAEAIAQYRSSLGMQPDNPDTCRRLAWVLATCPEQQLRDGRSALELAQRANQLSGGDPAVIATLAAAYAELGQFPEAVKAAEQALQTALARTNAPLAAALQSQLESYRAGLPVRATAQPGAAGPAGSSTHPVQ